MYRQNYGELGSTYWTEEDWSIFFGAPLLAGCSFITARWGGEREQATHIKDRKTMDLMTRLSHIPLPERLFILEATQNESS